MNFGLLTHIVITSVRSNYLRGRVDATPIPNTPNVKALNDLRQTTSFNMPDLNEAWIKEKDIWSMEGYTVGFAFPFDGWIISRRITMRIHIKAKF